MAPRDHARWTVETVLAEHASRLHAPTRPAALAELEVRAPKLARRYATAARTLLSAQDEACVRYHRWQDARFEVTPATLRLLVAEVDDRYPPPTYLPPSWAAPATTLFGLPVVVSDDVDEARGYRLRLVLARGRVWLTGRPQEWVEYV